jgi:hypothetical protein
MRKVIDTYLEAMRRIFDMDTTTTCGPRQHSRYSDLLETERSGDRIPVEAIFSVPIQTGPGAQPASCTMGTRYRSQR